MHEHENGPMNHQTHGERRQPPRQHSDHAAMRHQGGHGEATAVDHGATAHVGHDKHDAIQPISEIDRSPATGFLCALPQ